MIHGIRSLARLCITESLHIEAMRLSRRGGGGRRFEHPLKNHKNIGFLGDTRKNPLKNHKAAKPVFNVES